MKLHDPSPDELFLGRCRRGEKTVLQMDIQQFGQIEPLKVELKLGRRRRGRGPSGRLGARGSSHHR
ncbi:MAG: hypothetical protein R3B96_10375 [Pirellulaceae bacterium]